MLHVKLTDEEWERVRHHFPEERKPKGRRERGRGPTRDVSGSGAVDSAHGRGLELASPYDTVMLSQASSISGLGRGGRAGEDAGGLDGEERRQFGLVGLELALGGVDDGVLGRWGA